MDVASAFDNLNPIALFAGCILPMMAIPIGLVIAYIARRTLPLVSVLFVSVIAAYVVGVVVMFAGLRRLVPDSVLTMYGAAVTSLIVVAGIVVAVLYAIRYRLAADERVLQASQQEEQAFTVFGEDVRAKSKHPRHKP